ncbi:MAG: peptide ABC transporter permease [Gemmatimonadota bacterium]|nr:MAG: peptide ABC transporter permease [Gemmatimonadota bacterium]
MIEKSTGESLARTRLVLGRVVRRVGGRLGVFLLTLFLLMAAFGPALAPESPVEQSLADRLQRPGAEHWLGTDEFGRDVLSRLLYGTRISLFIGVISVVIGVAIGGTLGLVTGYFGGWVDQIGMRLMDILLAFPSILLAIIVVAVLGPSLANAMIAVGVVGVPHYARIVRASVLAVREMPFVEAERAVGAPNARILRRTILPHCTAPVLVQASLGLATAILDAAGLSFLGLGAQPPTPEWGAMLGQGRAYVIHAPWVLVAPGAAILLTVLGFNLVGDSLRDALDPRLAATFRDDASRSLRGARGGTPRKST